MPTTANASTGLELWDICASKHGGNPESQAANRRISAVKTKQRQAVLDAITASRTGLTCRELALQWCVGMNTISGRFSELKADGQIQKTGVRDGCAVFSTAYRPL